MNIPDKGIIVCPTAEGAWNLLEELKRQWYVFPNGLIFKYNIDSAESPIGVRVDGKRAYYARMEYYNTNHPDWPRFNLDSLVDVPVDELVLLI